MATSYEVWLSDQKGTRLFLLDAFESLQWARRVNDAGSFALVISSKVFQRSWFALDRRLEIWRRGSGAAKQLIMLGFLRYFEQRLVNDKETYLLAGPDSVDLLVRRVIAATTGTTQADKSDFADDMMKEYVNENLGSGAAAGRDISAEGWGEASDVSAAPSIDFSAAYANLFATMREISQASELAGTRLFFDVVNPTPTTFEFRTYTNQRGVDRTGSSGIVFAADRGTLVDPVFVQDWREEGTLVYAMGKGEGSLQRVDPVEDAARLSASVFNRREFAAEDRRYDTADALSQFGEAALKDKRPKRSFTATLQDSPQLRMGIEWGLGDKITAAFGIEQLEVDISAVAGQIDGNGKETIVTKLESVD